MSDRKMVASATPSGTRSRVSQGGFGLIELLMATVVLAIVMVGFAAVFGSAAREGANSANRTTAQQVATSELEKLRQMDYSSLGTVGGNPPGSVLGTKQVGDLTVKTKITFVNDPVPGAYATGKDYKAVRITITVTRTGRVVAEQVTKVAPPGAPGLNEGTIKVNVLDKTTNAPIVGATVNLAGGPGPAMSDDSDAAGAVEFAGLNPNDASGNPYDITATAPGYVTVPADLPPLPNASVRVAAASVRPLSIRMVKPIRVTATLEDDTTHAPFVTPVSVRVHPDGVGFGELNVTGGSVTSSTFGAAPIAPDTDYTFSAVQLLPAPSTAGWFSEAETYHSPSDETNPSSLIVPRLKMKLYPVVRQLKVIVKRAGSNIQGASVKVVGGPGSVSFMAATAPSGAASFMLPSNPSGYAVTVTDPMVAGSTATVNTGVSSSPPGTTITVTLP